MYRTRSVSGWGFVALIFAVCCWTAMPLSLNAQCPGTQGQNGVYNPSCNTGNPGVVGSSAFIDASMFVSNVQNPDFCSVLNWVLNPQNHILPATGSVIDARGLPGNTGTTMTCKASPWAGIIAYPATILLPAGNITISNTWLLPNGTRVIGEGSTTPLYNMAQTIVQACTTSNCFQGSSMIQFGDSTCPSTGCTGITLEDVTLNGSGSSNGNGQAIDGVDNAYSRELSYAKNVAMFEVTGIGLNISGNAENSGPYTHITYDTGNSGVIGSACAAINSVSGGTRGLHELTCISDNSSQVAITLNSSNNSVEDVRIVGFIQGVVVASGVSNVLKNVWGDTIAIRGLVSPPTVVQIGSSAADVVLIGIQNPASGSGPYTIQDQATNTTLSDPAVAMYALGEPAANSNGYARFTTSPNAVTWITGTNGPSGSCAKGSLYSCIGSSCQVGSSSGALWACIGGSNPWSLID